MKPWNENAVPHEDVLRGTMDQADFAADLSQADKGKGPEEYRDPRMFFARTYITDGMRRLLVSVIRRLAGKGGDPVVQLQTSFGGGKTHTLLAVYHLAKGEVPAGELDGVSTLLDEAGVSPMKARVAVIDGTDLAPAQPRAAGKVKIATLWGELAWRLLGAEGYAMVKPSDESGTSPGKDVLIELLRRAAPCVLLFDELTAFIRQLVNKEYAAGTFAANLSFLQALTESVKQVEGAVLLATLPESEAELGGEEGKKALLALDKLFGRLDNVWKPVGAEESFEIVRRRLFKSTGEESARDEVCNAFAKLYRDHPNDFPPQTRESTYLTRLERSYPIHPEVFDRLYRDWSTLEGFQKTRGVLRYLAQVIHRLKANENHELLIMPGSLPLDCPEVRNESTRYLSQSTNWGSVIEGEIDTDRSKAKEIDLSNERIGQVYGARRVARTIFFGTAPYATTFAQGTTRGMTREEILLGAIAPGQAIGHYDDALRALADKLHYLFRDNGRFWFDTHPNLRREMESRAVRVTGAEITALLRDRVTKLAGNRGNIFTSYIVQNSGDLPDKLTETLQLAVFPMISECSYPNGAPALAEDVLRNAGENLRNYRNRVIFAPPEGTKVSKARELAKTYLAWCQILEEGKTGQLNLDKVQSRQAEEEKKRTLGLLEQEVEGAYVRILVPELPDERAKTPSLRPVSLRAREQGLAATAAKTLRGEDAFLDVWDPDSLREHLERHGFQGDAEDVSARRVWDDLGKYCYMERVLHPQVLLDSIRQGVEKGLFGCALGKDDQGGYRNLTMGSALLSLTLDAILVSRRQVEKCREEEKRKEEERRKEEESRREQEQEAAGRNTGETAGEVQNTAPGTGQGTNSVSTAFPEGEERGARSFTTPGTIPGTTPGWNSLRREETAAAPPDKNEGYLRLTATLSRDNSAGEMATIHNEILSVLNRDPSVDIEVKVDIIVSDSRKPLNPWVLQTVTENIEHLPKGLDIQIVDE